MPKDRRSPGGHSTEHRAKLGLKEFARVRKNKDCPVCKIAPAVLEQITHRGKGNITLDIALEWLREVHGVVITEAQYLQHTRGAHGR